MHYTFLATLTAFVLLIGCVGLYFARRERMASARPAYQRPRLGRIAIARCRCRHCNEPMNDGDLAVWFEHSSGGLAHAACAVLIQKADGTVARLTGAVVPTDPLTGGVLTSVPGILLTEQEWADWSAGAEDVRC